MRPRYRVIETAILTVGVGDSDEASHRYVVAKEVDRGVLNMISGNSPRYASSYILRVDGLKLESIAGC